MEIKKRNLALLVILIAYSQLSISSFESFEQKLDHFNLKTVQTFSQRFEVDSSRAKLAESPVFFYLGGEGEITAGKPASMQIGEFANQLPLGAHLVQVEHRFYGKSSPFKDLTPNNLNYLDMDQALEDFAAVQKYVTQKYNLTGPWISVGASYSANLAVFYRIKFPELVVGSIAYSQVLSLTGSPKWNQKFTAESRDLIFSKIYPKKCFERIQSVVKSLEKRFESSDLDALKLIAEVPQANDLEFLAAIADVNLTSLLYGDLSICEKLELPTNDKEDHTKTYINATVDYIKNKLKSNLIDQSFSLGAKQLAQSASANSGSFGTRQFAYQHCKHFNQPYFVASQDRRYSIIPYPVSLGYQKKFCESEFGLKKPFTNFKKSDFYIKKLLSNESTGIVFIDGEKDPWRKGSLLGFDKKFLDHLSQKNLYLVVEGGFHCPNYYPPGAGASASSKFVSEKTFDFIKTLANGKSNQ